MNLNWIELNVSLIQFFYAEYYDHDLLRLDFLQDKRCGKYA